MTSTSSRQADQAPHPDAATDPLLCALGMHRTDPLAQWNDGYYFSRCKRCGRDLVRTAFGRWTVPKGFRVVYAVDPPHEPNPVRLVREEANEPAAPDTPVPDSSFARLDRGEDEVDRDAAHASDESGSDAPEAQEAAGDSELTVRPLPIDEVFRSLRDGEESSRDPAFFADSPDDEPPEYEPYVIAPPHGAPDALAREGDDYGEDEEPLALDLAEEAPPPAPAPKPLIPDFMDDPTVPLPTYDLRTGVIAQPPPPAPAPPRPPSLAERVGGAAGEARAAFRRRAPRIRVAAAPSDRNFFERYAGIAAALLFGVFVLAAALVDRSNAGFGGVAYRPVVNDIAPAANPRAATPATSPGAQPSDPTTSVQASHRSKLPARTPTVPANEVAFVTASLLNCRAVPSDDGAPVRRLTRGDSVRVLSSDPGWVSVSHGGRQCWASARYVSPIRPL